MDSLFFSAMAVLANADLIPFLIALLIGIPSAVLYCLELAIIVTNVAEFGAPFFVLVAVRAASLIIYVTASSFLNEQNNRYSLAQKWFGITLAEDDILFLATFNQYPWINDFAMVAIPAWLLLWASTKMREIIFSKFNRLGQSKQNVVTVKKVVVAPVPTNRVCPR
uniref:PreQ0 transporter n=1 Tax=Globodera pallida TaxID=36090 RepID=A0A183BIY8_GLOPA